MTLPTVRPFFLAWIVALLFLCVFHKTFVRAESSNYLALNQSTPLSGSPGSILLRSTYLDVPAGAELAVHLLKGQQIVATSTLKFTASYKSPSIFVIPPSLASFRNTGTAPDEGSPISGANLVGGVADLVQVAANPNQYQFLWTLSEGVIAPPINAVVTGGAQPVSFIDLKSISAAARQSDQKPGSVLFYQRYTSTVGSTAGVNTTLSLTNTSPTSSARVRMFFVAISDCKPFELAVCLSPQQTVSYLMSEFDPAITGYMIAVACDAQGNPTQFNWLIGNAQIRQSSPLTGQFSDASLSAIAVSKRTAGSLPATNNAAEMAFDDAMYDSLPAQLAADNVPSQSINATVVSFYRPVSNLAGATSSTPVNLNINTSTGQSVTAAQTVGCYADIRLSVLRTNPTITTLLSAGRTGWIRISANDNGPLIGAQFNSGQYSSGSSLRAITFAPDYRISIPIKAPGC